MGHGFFPDDHPHWPGLEWWGVIDWGTFKTHQLSLNNPYTHRDEYMAKFPVLSNGKDEGDVANDAGGAIGRFVEKLRLFEKANAHPEKCKTRFFRRVEKHKIHVNSHLGENTINKLFKLAFELMGVQDYEKLSGHTTRHWFVTVLANSPLVNLEETRIAARHTTPQMTVTYVDEGIDSTARRVMALMSGGEKERGQTVNQKTRNGDLGVGGAVEENHCVDRVKVNFTVPSSSGSSSFESEQGEGAPIEEARVEPSRSVNYVPISSPKKSVERNVYPAKRAVTNPYNEFKSAARVAHEQREQRYDSPIRLSGRCSQTPMAVTSSPAKLKSPSKLKSPEIFRAPSTPKSYRSGPVWMSQFDCSPDRVSSSSRSPRRSSEKPFSESTQMEYNELQESMEGLRRAREDTNKMLEQQVSHRRNEIRNLRKQIEALQRKEERRQEYIQRTIMYGGSGVAVGERERKRWREEDDVFQRTFHNSQYRLRNLQHAWERDLQELERSRREVFQNHSRRDCDWRSSSGGYAYGSAGRSGRNDSDDSFDRHLSEWDMDRAIAREMEEREKRYRQSRSRKSYSRSRW